MTIDLRDSLEELNGQYPCRENQISSLASLLGHSSYPSPPAIWISGGPGTGKSTITRAFLDAMEVKYAWVDGREPFTPALLLDRIVNSLRGVAHQTSRVKMSSDVNNFAVEVFRALEALSGKVFLVLDDAHHLSQLNPEWLLSTIARLPTLQISSSCQLSIIFIGTSVPLRNLGGLPLPTINFPAYTKPQLLCILDLYAPISLFTSSNRPAKHGDLPTEELDKIWEGLNSAVIDTYGPGTSLDVQTILRLSTDLWPEFVQPVIDAGVYVEEDDEIVFGRVDFVGLFALGKRKGLFSGEDMVKRQSTFVLNTTRTMRHELPYYSKMLLIAAFLASFNPSRDDTRIFSRDSGTKRRNRRPGKKSNKGIAKMSQRLIGPRIFDFERMMAIFHSITNYEVKQTVDIHMQVATLGTLKFIIRANRGDPLLGGGRWKVNVPEEEVRKIAGSVGFSLNDHLVD